MEAYMNAIVIEHITGCDNVRKKSRKSGFVHIADPMVSIFILEYSHLMNDKQVSMSLPPRTLNRASSWIK